MQVYRHVYVAVCACECEYIAFWHNVFLGHQLVLHGKDTDTGPNENGAQRALKYTQMVEVKCVYIYTTKIGIGNTRSRPLTRVRLAKFENIFNSLAIIHIIYMQPTSNPHTDSRYDAIACIYALFVCVCVCVCLGKECAQCAKDAKESCM